MIKFKLNGSLLISLLIFVFFNGKAQSLQDYPWLDGVVSDNCCLNQTATAYDFGHYSYVYIKANENCAPNGKLYREDGRCWCEDRGDTFCLEFYDLISRAGEVIYECEDTPTFTPFDQFDWLESVVNTENCDLNGSISIYLRKWHYYIFVESQNGLGTLYYSDGDVACNSKNNYDCVALYDLSDETLMWTCGDGQTEAPDITLRNTLQDPDEPEVTYPSLFGQADDAYDEFATLSETETEFPTALAQSGTPAGDINGLYSIDLTETSIEFSVLPDESDPFWVNVFGVFPAEKFDRYYFTFAEPHNITSAASNHTSVNLTIISETEVVVEISEGFDLQPGVSFFISLNGDDGLTNEQKARAFNEGLSDGDASVIKWIRNDYLQHNLGVPTGKAPIAGFYGGQPTGITVNVHRSFQVGDYVFAQTTLGGTWGATNFSCDVCSTLFFFH